MTKDKKVFEMFPKPQMIGSVENRATYFEKQLHFGFFFKSSIY